MSNPETSLNTFLLSINANGLVTFSQRLWTSYSTGLAVNSSSQIAVSAQDLTQTPWMHFDVFDSAGNRLWGFGGSFAGEMGFTDGIAIGPTGRVFVNMAPKWSPSGLATPWQHLFGFDPP